MVSSLDKKWMNPQLKNLLRQTQREFFKKRRSPRWRKLKKKYKRLKRKTVQSFYDTFIHDLKTSNPAKWYSMAKRLGAESNNCDGEVAVECLSGLDNQQAAEKVAEFFSQVSQEYAPLDTNKLPAYLPAHQPQKLDENQVAEQIYKLKIRKTNSAY